MRTTSLRGALLIKAAVNINPLKAVVGAYEPMTRKGVGQYIARILLCAG